MELYYEFKIDATVEKNEQGNMIITEIDGRPVQEMSVESLGCNNKPLVFRGGDGNVYDVDWKYKYVNECNKLKTWRI